MSEEKLVELVRNNFDLRPAGIIRMLDLRRPIYKQTALRTFWSYGSRSSLGARRQSGSVERTSWRKLR